MQIDTRGNPDIRNIRPVGTAGVTRDEDAAKDDIDLAAVLSTLWRGKFWIFLGTLLGLVVAGYYVFVVAVPMYTATATLALEARQSNVVDLEGVVSGLSADTATINTELEVMTSRGLVRKLVERENLVADPEFNPTLREPPRLSLGTLRRMVREAVLGPVPPAPPPSAEAVLDATVGAVRSRIEAANKRNSYVFTLSVTTTDRQKSARLANALADLYILNQLDAKFEATRQATDWLTERVGTLEKELAEAETAVKDFNARTELISPEALEALNRQAKDTRERIATLKATLAEAEARLARLRAAWDTGDKARMAAAAAEVAGDRAPTAAMEDRLFRSRYLQLMKAAETSVQRTRTQIEGLSASVEETEARIRSQSQDLVELQKLTRKAEALRSVYEYFLNRLQEIAAQQGIQQADSRLLSPAVVPGAPSSPKTMQVLGGAGFLGFMAAAGLVLWREFTNRTLRTAEALERLTGLPVLGQVPLIPGSRRRNQIEYLAARPTSAGAEAIRNLRTSVLFSNVDRPPRVIMLTSSVPGEGKSTLSLALAMSFSGLGRKVLVIEGDLRRQVFSRYFRDQEATHGVLHVLTGQTPLDEAVQHSELLGADVLRAEKTAVAAADIFSSASFARLIEEAKARYDIIIIDTPPVLVVPDARSIAQVADAVVLAVKWDDTDARQVSDTVHLLETVNVRPAGTVLNQINPRGMKRYGYGGKYGAYASYGEKYYRN